MTQLIPTTTLKIHNLLTYEMAAVGFEISVKKLIDESYGDGVASVLTGQQISDSLLIETPVRSAFTGGRKDRFMIRSNEVIFHNLEAGKAYAVTYVVVTSDGRYSDVYVEREVIGDSVYENPDGSPTVSLSTKSVVSDNGTIRASVKIVNIPTDHLSTYFWVKNSAGVPAVTDAPDYRIDNWAVDGSDGDVVLEISGYAIPGVNESPYIYVAPVDASRNRFAAELIGQVDGLTAPATPTLVYMDGVIRASLSYDFTNNPPTDTDWDVQKIEFNVSRDGGSTWVTHDVLRPDDASGATTIQLEFSSEDGVTYTYRARAINSINMQSTYSSTAEVACPYRAAAVGVETTALIPFNQGVGSTDGLYPSNISQVFMRRDGRYGGCVEVSEIPGDVLDWGSQPNLMQDHDMQGGLDMWKSWALSFDGDNDYVNVGDQSDLDFGTSDFSIHAIIKPVSNFAGTINIVSKGGFGVSGGYVLAFDGNEKLVFNVEIANGTVYELISTSAYPGGVEMDIIAVRDASSATGMKLYVNGVEIAYDTQDDASGVDVASSGFNFAIGAENGLGNTGVFNGQISYTRIFNRALSEPEVLYYSKGYPTKPIDKGASQTEMITDSDNTDFGDGTINEWVVATDGNGTLVYDAGPGAVKTGKLTVGGTAGTYQYATLPTAQATAFQVEKTYRVTADIYIPSANNNWSDIEVGVTGIERTGSNSTVNLAIEDAWQTIITEFTINGTDVTGSIGAFGLSTTSGDIFYIDNISVTQIGVLGEWDFREGVGSYLMDKSGNGLVAAINGATWVTDSGLLKSPNQAWKGAQSLLLPNSRVSHELDLPAVPIGAEKVTNGAFTSNTTGWSTTDCTILSVSGGQQGNCLEITKTGGTWQQAYRTLALTVGALYKLVVWVRSGTSGDEAYEAYVEGSGVNALYAGTSSSTWTRVELIFEATETAPAIKLRKNSSTAGTMLFDTVSIVEVEYQNAFLYSQMAFLPTRGSDLVTNGGFDTNTDNWTSPVDATLDSIAGGESGNCLEITRTADTQVAYQSITGLTIGNWYRTEIYIKDGSQTGLVNTFAVGTTIGGTETKSLSVTTNAVWTKYALVFEATATSHYINYNSVITSGSLTTLIDSVTFFEINMLDIGVEGYQVLKGTASTFLSDQLEDTILNQFADVAAGDWVHNTTDDTWGQIDSQQSDSEITPNWNMFLGGDEDYEIYVLAKSSGYISHFEHGGANEWDNKSLQLVTGQYDNRLVFTYSKNPNDQASSSYLDFQHLLKQNDDGLVGHWKLSRRDGARDLSGQGNHGTISGAIYADDHNGIVDGALDFDGSDDKIITGTSSSLAFDNSTKFSLEGWIKTTDPNDNRTIAGLWQSGGNDSHDIINLQFNSGSVVLYVIEVWSGQHIATTVDAGTLADGVWHHVVGTYDGSDNNTGLNIYIDGILQISTDSGSGSISTMSVTNTFGISNNRWKPTLYTDGLIEGVRLYSRELSVSEIAALYDGTKELYTESSINYLKQGGVPIQLSSDFDKDERVIKYSTNGIINLSALSISFDVKLLKYVSTGYFINHDDANDRILLYQKNSDGSLYLRLGSGAEADSGFNMILERWYKVALILDGTNYTLIVDGTVEKTNTYTGLDAIVSEFNLGADASGINWGNCLIENFRIDKVAKTVEQIRAFHELQVPFFDPDPNTSSPGVISFTNTDNIYPVSPKDNLQQQGTVTITNGSDTIQGIGTEFENMFQDGEKIQFLGTSAGDVVYTVQSITNDDTLVLTANIAEVTVAGLDYKNFTWKYIVDMVSPLKFIKKVKTF